MWFTSTRIIGWRTVQSAWRRQARRQSDAAAEYSAGEIEPVNWRSCNFTWTLTTSTPFRCPKHPMQIGKGKSSPPKNQPVDNARRTPWLIASKHPAELVKSGSIVNQRCVPTWSFFKCSNCCSSVRTVCTWVNERTWLSSTGTGSMERVIEMVAFRSLILEFQTMVCRLASRMVSR